MIARKKRMLSFKKTHERKTRKPLRYKVMSLVFTRGGRNVFKHMNTPTFTDDTE
jgi:hypothetical protein